MQTVALRSGARIRSSSSYHSRMKLLFQRSSVIGGSSHTLSSSCCILPCLLVLSQSSTHAWVATNMPTTRSLTTTAFESRRQPTTTTITTPFHLSATTVTSGDDTVLMGEAAEDAAVPAVDKSRDVDDDDMSIVAEGTIVSSFSGGLTAIRIKDEWVPTLSAAASAPNAPSSTDTTAAAAAAATVSAAAASAATLGSEQSKLAQPPQKMMSMGGDDLLGRNVAFSNGDTGMVVAHRPPVIFVYSHGGGGGDVSKKENSDNTVHVLKSKTKVSFDPLLSATTNLVIDAFGQPSAGAMHDETTSRTQQSASTSKRAIFSPIPQLKDIALINNPMLTGVTMVDALAPLGQGQNMLMIGHDAQDMRKYAIDFVQTQLRQQLQQGENKTNKNQKMCVYAAIDDSKQVFELLEKAGIKDQVHVVVPKSTEKATNDIDEASKAAEAVAMSGTACALAESYAIASDNNGLDTLVIIDTIDYHKKLWDSTTRVLVDVFGVDAVVKADREGGASSEMRAFYSSLIQRAGQYKKRKGGGSVTLVLLMTIPRLHIDEGTVFIESDFDHTPQKIKDRIKLLVQRNIPLTEATLRKIGIPIPSESEGQVRLALQHADDLISMSDGQIWFDEDLVNVGQRPPMDPERSVTRIGIGADTASRADAPAIRRIVEGLRLDLSQAANMEGAEETNATKKQIQRKNALLLAMHQKAGEGGRLLSESCAVLLAASRGYLDDVVASGATAGTDEGRKTVDGILKHLWVEVPRTMSKIDETLDMTNIQQKQIEDAIKSFLS